MGLTLANHHIITASYDLTHQLTQDVLPILALDMDDLLYWDGGMDTPGSIMNQIQIRVIGFFQEYGNFNGNFTRQDAEDLANYLYKHPIYGNSPFGIFADDSEAVRKFRSSYTKILADRLEKGKITTENMKQRMHQFPLGLSSHLVEDMHRDLDYSHLQPNPELIARLEQARARGILIYTFTNAPASHQKKTLEKLGLANFFDGTNCMDDRFWLPKPKDEAFIQFKEAVATDVAQKYISGKFNRHFKSHGKINLPAMLGAIRNSDDVSHRSIWTVKDHSMFCSDSNTLVFEDHTEMKLRFIFADDNAKNVIAGVKHGMVTVWADPHQEIPKGCHLVLRSPQNPQGFIRVVPRVEKLVGMLNQTQPLSPEKGSLIVTDLTSEPLSGQVKEAFTLYNMTRKTRL